MYTKSSKYYYAILSICMVFRELLPQNVHSFDKVLHFAPSQNRFLYSKILSAWYHSNWHEMGLITLQNKIKILQQFVFIGHQKLNFNQFYSKNIFTKMRCYWSIFIFYSPSPQTNNTLHITCHACFKDLSMSSEVLDSFVMIYFMLGCHGNQL